MIENLQHVQRIPLKECRQNKKMTSKPLPVHWSSTKLFSTSSISRHLIQGCTSTTQSHFVIKFNNYNYSTGDSILKEHLSWIAGDLSKVWINYFQLLLMLDLSRHFPDGGQSLRATSPYLTKQFGQKSGKSPDMNFIENLRMIGKRRTTDSQPQKTSISLMCLLMFLDPEMCHKLIEWTKNALNNFSLLGGVKNKRLCKDCI